MAKTFHFTRETPPESLFADIKLLNKFTDKQFHHLSQISLEYLQDPNKSSHLLNQVDEFAREQSVGAGALRNVFKSLISVPNSALRNNLTSSQLNEDFVNLGLSGEKSSIFTEQWQSNHAGLSRNAMGRTLQVNQLVDMEWKFGVTTSSSEVNKVANTFLQLKLVINKGNNRTENVFMELTLPQFYAFLHEMEKARVNLEQVS